MYFGNLVDDRMKQFNASGSPAVGGEFPYMVNDFKSQMHSFTWFSIYVFFSGYFAAERRFM
jgi:hypothetical protein